MKKGLYALAFGTFGLGIAEYSMMGILPEVANSLSISIAEAGHLISAYAIGVCVGAPLIVLFARNWPLRKVLLALMGIFTLGCLLTIVSPNYFTTLIARFITGLPHGSFFGVGAIVANKLASEGKGSSAVATMVMGMATANLLGNPLCTLLSNYAPWRYVFLFGTLLGCITIFFILRWIPELPPMPKTNIKGIFRFLKRPEPWLLLMGTMFANGGIFSIYSYISPLLTNVSGFSPTIIPLLMVFAGAGMCIGNYLGGRFADRYSPGIVSLYISVMAMVVLILMFFFASNAILAVVLMGAATACLFGISSPQQQLCIELSPGGEMMGGAMVQLAFNLGNAIGAYAGGVVIDAHYSEEYTALAGAVFALLGIMVYMVLNFYMLPRRRLAMQHLTIEK